MPGAHASFIGSVTGPKLAFRQPVAFLGRYEKPRVLVRTTFFPGVQNSVFFTEF